MPVPSSDHAPRAAARRAAPTGARRAARRSRRCPPRPAGRAARSSGRGTGTPSSGRCVDQRVTPVALLHQGRDPEAHRDHVRSRRPDLLDGLDEDVERLLAVRSTPRPMHPVVDHEILVDDPAEQLRAPRVDADYPPWRHGRTIYRGRERSPHRPSDPGPPEYNVYRSRRRPPGELGGGGDLERLRSGSALPRREPHQPGERRGITPGRVLKWVAVAVVAWLLLSLVLFLVSAQTEEGVSDSAKQRALERGAASLRQQHPRARLRRAHRRVDRRVPAGPVARRHDHARPLGLRQRTQAVDPARLLRRDPGPRRPEDQRRLRAGRAGADDPDRRGVHGQRAAGEPPDRGRLRGLPEADRRARRHRRERGAADLLAALRQLLEGPALQQGRAPPRRRARARVTRGSARTPARRTRPTSTAPSASSRCCTAIKGSVDLPRHLLPAPARELAGAARPSGPT